MKLKTQAVILVVDLIIIVFGMLLRFGVIVTATPPSNLYFVGPYLLLLTILLNFYRASRNRKKHL